VTVTCGFWEGHRRIARFDPARWRGLVNANGTSPLPTVDRIRPFLSGRTAIIMASNSNLLQDGSAVEFAADWRAGHQVTYNNQNKQGGSCYEASSGLSRAPGKSSAR
jgi:hypothetical protein